MKERITISLDKDLVDRLDKRVDNVNIRNRSHAIEQLLNKVLAGKKIKKALILAGGEGTRLRPFTYELPKALIPLKGKPIMEHIIEHLKNSGIEHILLSIGYKSEKIIAHFGNGERFGLKIDYVVEDKAMGTAGPLNLAKDHLDETFLMLNGDILSRIDVQDLFATHTKSNAVGTITLVTVSDPSRFGVAKLKGNKIVGFVEKPKKGKAPSNLINAGMYVLEPSILDYVPKGRCSIERDVFPKLAKDGKLVSYIYNGAWFDLGTTESYEKAIKGWK